MFKHNRSRNVSSNKRFQSSGMCHCATQVVWCFRGLYCLCCQVQAVQVDCLTLTVKQYNPLKHQDIPNDTASHQNTQVFSSVTVGCNVLLVLQRFSSWSHTKIHTVTQQGYVCSNFHLPLCDLTVTVQCTMQLIIY